MNNKQINIALLGGGYSGEYQVSLRSMETIYTELSKNSAYVLHKLIIDKEAWFYIDENNKHHAIDKNDFSVTVNQKKILFDLVFIIIHGSPGEDGKLQSYFEMLQIPFTTSNSISSALTFNKFYCNQVVKNANIVGVAKSVVLNKSQAYSLGAIMEELQLPVFVKPNESGSSLGISKVNKPEELVSAIDFAFNEDDLIIIEEFIDGIELTMGVYAYKDEIITLPATEIIPKNEFFDFEAKYTPGATNEITPARISENLHIRMSNITQAVYKILNCKGVVRMDYIYKETEDRIYFLEVNTVPGQSKESLIPQQVLAAGLTLEEFYSQIVEESLKEK